MYYRLLDWIAFRCADVVLFDTAAHCSYIAKTYGISPMRLKRIFVGAEDDIFYPRFASRTDNRKTVLFYGYYIPLHGVETIVQAAEKLRGRTDIEFILVGSGQDFPGIKTIVQQQKLSNVRLVPPMPIKDISDQVAAADICLGIFGTGDKTQRVIPNKVF